MRLADAHGHATAVLAMHHPENNTSPWEHFFVSNLETSGVGKGIQALRQLGRTLWSYEAYKKTRAIIAAFKPDVIHAHNLYTHLSPSVLSAAKDAGVPVVLTAHDYGYISANYGLFDGVGPLSAHASWRDVVRTKCIKNSAFATGVVDAVVRVQKRCGMWTQGVTHILTASHAVKKALTDGGYRAMNIRVLPLPSGASVGAENVPPVRTHRIPQIIFASRFETYKGVDVLMELVVRMPDVTFVCVGHGAQEEPLRKLAAKRKNLSVLSVQTPQALWEMIKHAAGVIVPSRWPEPFGLVGLESLSLGTPVIVSSEGGLSEIVEHGISGFVEHPDALDVWEKHIRFLLASEGDKNASAVQEMRLQAAVRGIAVGDPDKHWEGLFGIYTEAIQ